MPVAVRYPGVDIQDAAASAHTIVPVATAITAFVGRALRGPVDEPVAIHSYADFERQFGVLWHDSALGYAVRDFYVNGGRQAIIVRLYHPPAARNGKLPSHAILRAGGLTLRARDPGSWGNALQVRVDHDVQPPDPNNFNLLVRDAGTGQIEVFRNVSTAPGHPRRIDLVLKSLSRMVAIDGLPPVRRPAANTDLVPGQADTWVPGAGSNTGVLEADRAGAELPLVLDDFIGSGKMARRSGLYALARADLFNILCIPPYLERDGDLLDADVDPDLLSEAAAFCELRRAMLLVDPPSAWTSAERALEGVAALGTGSRNAALFFPRLVQPVAQRDERAGVLAPCGAIAGIFARTDCQRGVWKAPAGLDASLVGVPALSVALSEAENGMLNPLGINCLRSMPAAGRIVWGARTLQGSDAAASDWKYIPVRRTALFIEESLIRGTQWVMFEPNDEALWAQIRLAASSFMHGLFRQGAFQGRTPQEAYFVRCDRHTTSVDDVQHGVVNITVGFAPQKPAEFVLVSLQCIAGQLLN